MVLENTHRQLHTHTLTHTREQTLTQSRRCNQSKDLINSAPGKQPTAPHDRPLSTTCVFYCQRDSNDDNTHSHSES